MKKLLILWALLVGISVMLYAVENEKPVIKVGVVMPMSGNNAYMGEMGRLGLEMRLKELGDNSKFKYQIIYEDDGFVFSRTAMAVKKLQNIDKVDVLMTMWGYGSDIALPQIKNNPNILHLNVDRISSEYYGDRDFVIGTLVDDYINKFLTFAKAMGYRRIAYFGTYDQDTEIFRKTLSQRLQSSEFLLVDNTSVPVDTRDLRTYLVALKEKAPDIIIYIPAMPVTEIFLKQKKELGYTVPCVTFTPALEEVQKGLNEAQGAILACVPNSLWIETFRRTLGKGEYSQTAAQMYDTMTALIQAAERLPADRKPTTKELADSIRNMGSFEGATGTLTWTPPNRFEAPVGYFIFKNGKAEPVSLEELVKHYKK